MPRKMHPADAANAEVIARATSFRITLYTGRGYVTDTAATIEEAKAKAADMKRHHVGHREPLIYGIDPEGRSGIYMEPIMPATAKKTPVVTTAPADDLGIPAFLKRDPAEAKKTAAPAKKPAPAKAKEPPEVTSITESKRPAPAKPDPKKATATVVDLRGVTPPNAAPAEKPSAAEKADQAARAKERLAAVKADGKAAEKRIAAAAKKADPKPAAKPAKEPAKKAATKKEPAAPRAGSKTEIVLKMLKKGATRKAIVEATDGWNVDLKQLAARKGLKLHKDAEGVFTAK